jgi:hypothetical protein
LPSPQRWDSSDRRFENNNESGRGHEKTALYISNMAIRSAIPAEFGRAKSGSKNVSQAAKIAGTSLREVEIWVAGAAAAAYGAT